MKHTPLRAVAAVAVLALTLTACGGRSSVEGDGASTPGITDTEVVFGTTCPYSGPASAYGVIPETAKAYFASINKESGGVKMGDGKTRKIRYIAVDDAYEPNRTVEAVRKLIEQDKVFGLSNMCGTANNLAVREYINQKKVPHVFISGGASQWGADTAKFPWDIGWSMAYTTESAIWAKYLLEKRPHAKVAILYQNDAMGLDFTGGFKQAIKGSDIEIVAEKSYNLSDATVESQVTDLAASGADVFLNISTPKFAAQAIKKKAELGWDAEQFVASPARSIATVYKPAGLKNAKGIISIEFLKDPSDPAYAEDSDVVEFKKKLAEYGGGRLDPADHNVVQGWAAAETLVEALKQTKQPTRESFMEAVRSLNIPRQALLIDGIGIKTGPGDNYPVESSQLNRFNGEVNEPMGGVISYEGNTPMLKK